MREITDGAVEGRVVTGGVAQSVHRDGGVVHIQLTCMPGGPLPRTEYAGMITVPLPEPVRVQAGEWVAVEMGWLPEPDREEAAGPVHMCHDMAVTKVAFAPSLVRPGHTQGMIG